MEKWHLNLGVQSFCFPARWTQARPSLHCRQRSWQWVIQQLLLPALHHLIPAQTPWLLGKAGQDYMSSFAALVQIQAWNSGCLLLPEHTQTGTAQETGNGAAEKHLGLRDSFLWQLAQLEANPCPLKRCPSLSIFSSHKLFTSINQTTCTMLIPAVKITAQHPSPSQNNP